LRGMWRTPPYRALSDELKLGNVETGADAPLAAFGRWRMGAMPVISP